MTGTETIARVNFSAVRFRNFKAFSSFSLSLRSFNVMVGPNNCGKSTVIGAFRILSEGIRRARARKPELLHVGDSAVWGYRVPLADLPIATENVFHNYADATPATVQFELTNGNELILHFPAVSDCYMTCVTTGKSPRTPTEFMRDFGVTIGFVPVLGPVEHNEECYKEEAARLALLSHRASRNFRNIWHHFPEGFDTFREHVQSTWPGMDIQKPEVDRTHNPPRLHMFCPEERIPRELFWAGFGFQVWCQLLTFVVKSRGVSLFIIDEPDIYLHSDLQRQLVSILKGLGPDILVATHSPEFISEADPEDLLVVSKKSKSARRISNPAQLQAVFGSLGSNMNPVLTQLAKSRRAVFVEGKDFQVLSLFARVLGKVQVANRSDFAVIPVEGFNVQKVQDFTRGMELPLGGRISTAAVFDRDYRTDEAADAAEAELRKTCCVAVIHKRKELENFLLHPGAIVRAIERRVAEHNRRGGGCVTFAEGVEALLMRTADAMRSAVFGQYLAKRAEQERARHPHVDPASINATVVTEFETAWSTYEGRMRLVPGKQLLSALNADLQKRYGVTITATMIVTAFIPAEVPAEMVALIEQLDAFRSQAPNHEDGDGVKKVGEKVDGPKCVSDSLRPLRPPRRQH